MKKYKKIKPIIIVISIIIGITLYIIFNKKIIKLDNYISMNNNYGIFIDNLDNNYFLTKDDNIKKLFKKFVITSSDGDDVEKYGHSLIYYYDSKRFIEAQKNMPNNDSTITSYVLHDTNSGQIISGCSIYSVAGLQKNDDYILSVSNYKEEEGLCFYKRGDLSFSFFNMSPTLSKEETLFKDSTGQSFIAYIKAINFEKGNATIVIFRKDKIDNLGNYEVSRVVDVKFL